MPREIIFHTSIVPSSVSTSIRAMSWVLPLMHMPGSTRTNNRKYCCDGELHALFAASDRPAPTKNASMSEMGPSSVRHAMSEKCQKADIRLRA
jgi:hypothetical protein